MDLVEITDFTNKIHQHRIQQTTILIDNNDRFH